MLQAADAAGDIKLTGSDEENDTIYGNIGSNSLVGAAGNDTLEGRGGNDTLVGGRGSDRLSGGAGDDTYYVDLLDIVEDEAEDGGNADLLIAAQANGTYTLARGIENGQIEEGLEKVTLIGNDKTNTLYGNSQANSLDGNGGNDTLYGYDGNDTLKGGTGNDYMEGGYR